MFFDLLYRAQHELARIMISTRQKKRFKTKSILFFLSPLRFSLQEIWFTLCILQIFAYFTPELFRLFCPRTIPFANHSKLFVKARHQTWIAIRGDVHIHIAMQNVIVTFWVGGWAGKIQIWRFQCGIKENSKTIFLEIYLFYMVLFLCLRGFFFVVFRCLHILCHSSSLMAV